MWMRAMAIATLLGVMVLLALPLKLVVAQMSTSAEFEERAAQTASYTIKIRTGPKVTMAMSSTMTTADQGKPVNRHIEVHVFNRSSGAEVKDVVPVVRVTNQATGASRALTNLMACRTSNHRETEPHFGDNVYLPDGRYIITVAVRQDTAVFRDVVLKATK